ncbi:MAG: TauD/TfdA dioxygenase family protein [Gammaproteobacteria bacterium]
MASGTMEANKGALEIRVEPASGRVGADIAGVDVKHLSNGDYRLIRRAWLKHHVLRIRDQTLSYDDLISFSERFGELDDAPINITGEPWIAGYPKLAVMSNVLEGGEPVGSLGYGEAVWHTDMSYKEITPSAALLYAIEVTESGGETGFVSMHEAYDSLDASMKRELEGKRIKHDASRNSAGTLRKGFDEIDDPRDAPGARHPIVIRHPETGARALFLGRRPYSYVVGMDLDESEALLDVLWAHATDEENAWYQKWAVGDLLIWDNRSVMHKRTAFDPRERRYLLRTQVKGSVPAD